MSRFTIDDEPVKLLLSGIFKSGKTVYFRIDEQGKHVKVNVSLALRSLKMSHHVISRLISAFPWPKLQYYSDYMRKVDEIKGKPREKKVKIRVIPDEEPDEEEIADEETGEVPTPKSGKANKHFYIVEQGEYFGIYQQLRGYRGSV